MMDSVCGAPNKAALLELMERTGYDMLQVLYVRNLMLSTPEATLEHLFNQAAGHDGAVEHVTKLRDYAFIHFYERDDALRALGVIKGRLNPGLCMLLERYGEMFVGQVSELEVNGCFVLKSDADEQTQKTRSQLQDTLASESKVSPHLALPELMPGTVLPSRGDGPYNSLTEHKLCVDDDTGVKPACHVDLEDTDGNLNDLVHPQGNVTGKATDDVVTGGSGSGAHRGSGAFWTWFGSYFMSLLYFLIIFSFIFTSMNVKTVAVILNLDPSTLDYWLKWLFSVLCAYALLALSRLIDKVNCVLKFFLDQQTDLEQIIKNLNILTTAAVEFLHQHRLEELITVAVDELTTTTTTTTTTDDEDDDKLG